MSVADVLYLGRLQGATMDYIPRVVATAAKRRFQLRMVDQDVFMRAVQGHSISHLRYDEVGGDLGARGTKARQCAHGPCQEFWPDILNGLVAGGRSWARRNDIYFASYMIGENTAAAGMRHDVDMVECVEAPKAM